MLLARNLTLHYTQTNTHEKNEGNPDSFVGSLRSCMILLGVTG